MFNVVELPNDTEPPSVKPLPAVTVTAELAKLEFGTAFKLNVNVSDPALAEIAKPVPELDANVKVPALLSANKLVPLNDAVENALTAGSVDTVKYPESLLNCDTLLPETATFFHVAISYPYFSILYINIHVFCFFILNQ